MLSQAEKLEALIRKAIDSGWTPGSPGWAIRGNGIYYIGDVTITREDFATLIFNHDFARALFGEDVLQNPTRLQDGTYRSGDTYLDEKEQLIKVKPLLLAWQYHLQQAVISNVPIDHMYKAVFGDE